MHQSTKRFFICICFFISVLTINPQQSLAVWGCDDFFEIDGDYGSIIADVGGGDNSPDVNDGVAPDRHTTYGRLNEAGLPWVHATEGITNCGTFYPYMGTQMYLAECTASQGTLNDRTEQGLLSNAYIEDGQKYFSLAIYVPDNMPKPADGKHFYFAQWHQGGDHLPPLRFSWDIRHDRFVLGGYYDSWTDGVYCPDNFQDYQFYYDIPVERNKWHHFFFRCQPGHDTASIAAWKMDNATGLWEEICNYTNTSIGYLWNSNGVPLTGAELSYQWKAGTYRGAPNTWSKIYYDNIRYGRIWNIITRNKLIGYHKTVCDLQFNESSGTAAADSCWLDNYGTQGDATRDYNNDGILCNFNFNASSGWKSGGVIGNCLLFDGVNDYVRIPLDTVDFDFGNYLTFSCWFKTSTNQTGKALICQDYFVDGTNSVGWKARVHFNATTKIDFSVRHPDFSTSNVRYYAASSVFDGQWHHVVGTFNRFASDVNRLKIYFDGELGNQNTGADKPILRGNTDLYVGKVYNSGYFQGYIDEAMVKNYAMTESEVEDLYDYYVSE